VGWVSIWAVDQTTLAHFHVIVEMVSLFGMDF
jgi:hypothetical protein